MRRVEIVRDVRVKVEEMNAAEADAEGAVVDVAHHDGLAVRYFKRLEQLLVMHVPHLPIADISY